MEITWQLTIEHELCICVGLLTMLDEDRPFSHHSLSTSIGFVKDLSVQRTGHAAYGEKE
ncbi:MAG: hypothetical protein SVY10_06345 [Thermodesulfobacteriota bacterium]|nr:hypothetical protein [Thermodesulfobacteriota bacterium]